MFKLNNKLQEDTFFIKDLKLSKLLLMNNKNYPWLILVPRLSNITEIFHLNQDQYNDLNKEIKIISKISNDFFNADKMNIATLGNVVSQLHIHIIARYKNDNSFPSPVWIDKEIIPYNKDEAQNIIKNLEKFYLTIFI